MLFVTPALAQSTSTVLYRTIPVGTETHLGVHTIPNARCLLHPQGESSAAQPMKLFAADPGVVHFTIEMDTREHLH